MRCCYLKLKTISLAFILLTLVVDVLCISLLTPTFNCALLAIHQVFCSFLGIHALLLLKRVVWLGIYIELSLYSHHHQIGVDFDE